MKTSSITNKEQIKDLLQEAEDKAAEAAHALAASQLALDRAALLTRDTDDSIEEWRLSSGEVARFCETTRLAASELAGPQEEVIEIAKGGVTALFLLAQLLRVNLTKGDDSLSLDALPEHWAAIVRDRIALQ